MQDFEVFNEKLGLNGRVSQLLDWAYRYSDDYSDEALREIARLAKEYGWPEEKYLVPILVLKGRNREKAAKKTMPYEQMKLNHLLGGKISHEEDDAMHTITIFEDRDVVVVSINGKDDNGFYNAGNVVTIQEFMAGDGDWLEKLVATTLFYGRVYDQEEEETK